jgi:hypothetical protein
MAEMKNKKSETFNLEIVKGRDHLGDLYVSGRLILEWSLEKYGQTVFTGLNWLRIGSHSLLLGTR